MKKRLKKKILARWRKFKWYCNSRYRSLLRLFSKGNLGEQIGTGVLRYKGYKIAAQNWRCKAGEIDIIAWKKGVLSFIEVKSRKKGDVVAFSAFNAVDEKKQDKISRCAYFFSRTPIFHKLKRRTHEYSFDIIEVYGFRVKHHTAVWRSDFFERK